MIIPGTSSPNRGRACRDDHLAGGLRRGGGLVDPDQVAGRVADGEVPRAPELVGRLLHDLGARGANLLEGGVEVVGVEVDPVEGALGEEGRDRVPVGRAAVHVVGQDDRYAGLSGRTDGDPPEVVVGDVVAQFEAEHVTVEDQREVEIMDLDEGRDRKSTRLNSSHTVISYAVFCLKKT